MASDDVTVNLKVLGCDETFEMVLPNNFAISELKTLACDFCDFPVEKIRLLFEAKLMADNSVLRDYNLTPESTIKVVQARDFAHARNLRNVYDQRRREERQRQNPDQTNRLRHAMAELQIQISDMITENSNMLSLMRTNPQQAHQTLQNFITSFRNRIDSWNTARANMAGYEAEAGEHRVIVRDRQPETRQQTQLPELPAQQTAPVAAPVPTPQVAPATVAAPVPEPQVTPAPATIPVNEDAIEDVIEEETLEIPSQTRHRPDNEMEQTRIFVSGIPPQNQQRAADAPVPEGVQLSPEELEIINRDVQEFIDHPIAVGDFDIEFGRGKVYEGVRC